MIFNRADNGAEELRSLTGQYWKSNDFDKIRIKVELATEDLETLVGAAIVAKAEAHYQSDNYLTNEPETEPEGSDPGGLPAAQDSGSGGSGLPPVPNFALLDKLVQHIQLPIAFQATIWHYQGNDISHEDTGRKVKIDDTTEKLAWEWMYDRDDAAAMRNYQRTFDRLIRFLNANAESFPEWTNSPAKATTLSLFISTPEHFNQLYPIDSSPVFFLRLAPLMREIERKYIKPILGKDKFDELKAAILSGTIPEDDQELIEYICDPIPLLTMSKAVTRLSISLIPEGVVQSFISQSQTVKASTPITQDLMRKVSESLWKDGLKTIDELKKFWTVMLDDESETEPDITDMVPGMETTDLFISL
jgi:hypothetical protein